MLPINPVELEQPPIKLGEIRKMRISVDSNDRGYKTFIEYGGFSKEWKVYLDGNDVTENVIMADSETGKVELVCRTMTGAVLKQNNKVVHVVKHGNVVICPPKA